MVHIKDVHFLETNVHMLCLDLFFLLSTVSVIYLLTAAVSDRLLCDLLGLERHRSKYGYAFLPPYLPFCQALSTCQMQPPDLLQVSEA